MRNIDKKLGKQKNNSKNDLLKKWENIKKQQTDLKKTSKKRSKIISSKVFQKNEETSKNNKNSQKN